MKVAETVAIQHMWCTSCRSIQPIKAGHCWHCETCGTAGDSRSCRCHAAPALSLVRAPAEAEAAEPA